MAIPEHDKCVKVHKKVREYAKNDRNYYALVSNRQIRMSYPVFRKPKMRKLTIWFAKCEICSCIAKLRAMKLGFKNLVEYHKYVEGPHYKKWGKYIVK